jgi:hypothetical protein
MLPPLLVLALLPVPQTPAPMAGLLPDPVWLDLDGDGRLEALSIDAEGRLQLLASRSGASFVEVSEESGLGVIAGAYLLRVGDYDGDERPDLLVGTTTGAHLLHNEGGVFADVTATTGLAIEEAILSAHWLDEDADGRLDLHVATGTSSRVWRGIEGGLFEPVELPLDLASGMTPSGIPTTIGVVPAPAVSPGGDVAGRGDVRPSVTGPSPQLGGAAGVRAGGSNAGTQSLVAFPVCAVSIRDQAGGGGCLLASSAATLGMLYPLSANLFVDEATGNVGIGTTSPSYRLEVDGQIVGGEGSIASGASSTVSGGLGCSATGAYSTVSGGEWNSASYGGTVSGGLGNVVPGDFSTIGGGVVNAVQGVASIISGGWGNWADGYVSAIGGGYGNQTQGQASVVPGGRSNAALSDYSFAAGRQARAMHEGAFVWGDSQDDATGKQSTGVDTFNVFAEGGMSVFAEGTGTPSLVVDDLGRVGIGTATPAAPLAVEGSVQATRFQSFNPNNPSASVQFGWLSDVARFRTGGSGAGSNGGFDFQRIGDQSLLRILDNGNVGIGRDPATNALEVEGNASKSTAGSWLANSDRRIKRDVRDLEGALEVIERVRPVGFRYTAAYLAEHPDIEDVEYFNVIAQEFAEVFPDAVSETKEGILQVDTYPALIHALAAIQELAERNRQLAEQGRTLAEANARLELESAGLRDVVGDLVDRQASLEREVGVLLRATGESVER